MAQLNDLLILGNSSLIGEVSTPSKLTAHTITISEDAGAEAALQFSRGSWNYITAPTNGLFAFVPHGKSPASANVSLAIADSAVYPGNTNDAINLGTTTNSWKGVYATTMRASKDSGVITDTGEMRSIYV